MSDENESVGTVQVKVSPSQVHKAVRNILANEMKLDPVEIRNQIQVDAEKLIREKVIAYLDGSGYSEAQLKQRIDRCLNYYEQKFEEYLRKAIEAKVHSFLERELGAAIEGIIEKTQFTIGWNRTKVRVKLADPEAK